MSNNGWHAKFREAVLETDSAKLLERIEAAEKSIAERGLFGKELTVEECLALETSLDQLRFLRQERGQLHNAVRSEQAI